MSPQSPRRRDTFQPGGETLTCGFAGALGGLKH